AAVCFVLTCLSSFSVFLFHFSSDHPDLHSFPTRRSSDLVPLGFVCAAIFIVMARPDRRSLFIGGAVALVGLGIRAWASGHIRKRSEEHTSELQSQSNLVCRLLLEKKKKVEMIYEK